MRASTTELNQSEERLKEYQRQQERLKAMTANAEKVKAMSADVMIENLLKQNFAKPNSSNLENRINSGSGLPIWLECESAEVPEAYKHLWAYVKTPTNLADTQKVSQLLLTSGLHMEVLGFIWNLSNKAVPGQLNKQEFYIVLALVALAQSGYTFNNLSILNLVQNAPIPALQTKVLEKFTRSPTTSNNTYVTQVSQIRPINEDSLSLMQLPLCKPSENSLFIATAASSLTANEPVGDLKSLRKLSKSNSRDALDNDKDFPKASHFPCIGSSPTAELEDDDFSDFQSASVGEPVKKEEPSSSSQLDEFTDFQSADVVSDPLETVVISQRKEIPKIPLPRNLTGKLSNLRTNILKISPESEKKLKVLTQSETLSTLPESKISTNNKVSTMTSISVVAGSRDIGMRLANHSLGSKTDKTKHQRHKHKEPVHVDEIIFPSKFSTLDELFPKCFQKTSGGSKTFILKETKIGNGEAIEPESNWKSETDSVRDPFPTGRNTRKIEIPMLGTFNETTLPTQAESFPLPPPQPMVELFSVEGDKYSALREVELEMKLKSNEPKECDTADDDVDDFGEFLSAEIPSPISGPVSSAAPAEDTDLWGEWASPASEADNVAVFPNPLNDQSKRSDCNQKNAETALNFDLLTLTEEDCTETIRTAPEFDLELLTNKNKTEDSLSEAVQPQPEKGGEHLHDFTMLVSPRMDETSSSINNAKEDFEMFFTSEPTPAEGNRDDLLPSLNLKMLSSDTSEQEPARKKCLAACLCLIREGLHILNGAPSASVLREVLSTAEAVNYLNHLNVVYQISKRMGAHSGESFSIREEIETCWQKLVRYCCDYHVALKEDSEANAPIGTQCHVCLGFVGSDAIDNGISCYHASCANFWIHFVESELPCPM